MVRIKCIPRHIPATPALLRESRRRNAQIQRLLHPLGPRKRRFRPGVQVLKEIRRYQTSTNLLINKLPFQRLVKEIARNIPGAFNFQSTSLLALQEAAEAFLVELFGDAQAACEHSGRKTVSLEDMRLATRIRGLVTSP